MASLKTLDALKKEPEEESDTPSSSGTHSDLTISIEDQKHLATKAILLAQSLNYFILSSRGKWKLSQASQFQWKLTGNKPNFVFKLLRPILTSETQSLCDSLSLESAVTITMRWEAIGLEESHEFPQLMANDEVSHWSLIMSVQRLFPGSLPKILKSWSTQFSLLHRFLENLVDFLALQSLCACLHSPREALELSLSIGDLELTCQLMAQVWERPSLNVKIIIGTSTSRFRITNSSFVISTRLMMRYMWKHFTERFGTSISQEEQRMKQRRERVEKELNAITAKNDLFNESACSFGHQWVITLKQPFCYLSKISSKMSVEFDQKLCLQPLESSLAITLLSVADQSQCILNECHQIKRPKPPQKVEKCYWIEKDSDEVLIGNFDAILSSCKPQFDLVDLFCSRLDQLLTEEHLCVTMLPPELENQVRSIILKFDNIKIRCELIPPCSYRPLIVIDVHSTSKDTFEVKDGASLKRFFKYFMPLISNEVAATSMKRKQKLYGEWTQKKKFCEMVEEPGSSQQSSYLLSIMEELKTILMEPSQQVSDHRNDKALLMDRVKIWQQSGFEITYETASCLKRIQAQHGGNKLIVEFRGLRDQISWKLRLCRISHRKAGLMTKGFSTNFYKSLIACLELFLEQKNEDYITVEVEVTPDNLEPEPEDCSRDIEVVQGNTCFLDVKEEEC